MQIISADESDAGKLIIKELQKKFPTARHAPGGKLKAVKGKLVIYVTVGPAALRGLLSQSLDGVVLSLFTSSQSYNEILEDVPEGRDKVLTAIYADPSPFDQMRLISAIYQKPVSVAVLLSNKNVHLLPILKEAASTSNIALSIEPVSSGDDINRLLNRVANAAVLLAIPDNTIYNAENIRNILITTYRRDQAVVGFSAAFVKAGALASTVSSIDDVLAQTEELLSEFSANGRLPPPQFPKYFDVIINNSVARSLNLVIGDNVEKLARKPGGHAR
jgi:ABC-type uncharacterized transport system substrate-binding protein